MKITDALVCVKQDFSASQARIWQAITVVAEMQKWFFPQLKEFEARVGFETLFSVESDGRVFPHRWKILNVKAPECIVYDWRHDGYVGKAIVEFFLTSQHESLSSLTLTCRVVEDFSDDIPEFRRESCEAGWNYFIKEQLNQYVEGK